MPTAYWYAKLALPAFSPAPWALAALTASAIPVQQGDMPVETGLVIRWTAPAACVVKDVIKMR